MDLHLPEFQSYIVHQLAASQLEMFWSAYKQAEHVMMINDAIEELDLFTEPSDDPISAQEIKTFKTDMTNLTSFKGL